MNDAEVFEAMRAALTAEGLTCNLWQGRRLYVKDRGRELGYLVAADRGGTGECRGVTGRRGYVAEVLRRAFAAAPAPVAPATDRPVYVTHPMGVACPDCRAAAHVGQAVHHSGRCDLLPKRAELAHVGHPVGGVPAAPVAWPTPGPGSLMARRSRCGTSGLTSASTGRRSATACDPCDRHPQLQRPWSAWSAAPSTRPLMPTPWSLAAWAADVALDDLARPGSPVTQRSPERRACGVPAREHSDQSSPSPVPLRAPSSAPLRHRGRSRPRARWPALGSGQTRAPHPWRPVVRQRQALPLPRARGARGRPRAARLAHVVALRCERARPPPRALAPSRPPGPNASAGSPSGALGVGDPDPMTTLDALTPLHYLAQVLMAEDRRKAEQWARENFGSVATPALGWRDQYRELWTRLGALAMGDHPPPLEAIVEEAQQLLRDHAIVKCGGNVTRAAERLATGRHQLRAARGWLIRLTDMRRALNAQPVLVWRVASAQPGPDGQVVLPVPESARALVAAGPIRVTVEPVTT